MHTRVQKCYLLKTVLCIAFQNMATVFSPLHDFNIDKWQLTIAVMSSSCFGSLCYKWTLTFFNEDMPQLDLFSIDVNNNKYVTFYLKTISVVNVILLQLKVLVISLLRLKFDFNLLHSSVIIISNDVSLSSMQVSVMCWMLKTSSFISIYLHHEQSHYYTNGASLFALRSLLLLNY